jgi:putative addiction module antidote
MRLIQNNNSLVYNGNRVKLLASLYFFIRRDFMEVERKIRKIGNSLGVLLPSDMLKEIGVEKDDTVYITVEDGELIIRSESQKETNDKFKEKVLAIIEEYMEEHDGK